MENQIITSQKNSTTVVAVITGVATIDTATLTVKWDASDTTATIEKAGSVSGLTVTFTITPTDNDISPGHYVYDINIAEGTDEYTPVSGIYTVNDGVKN